VVLNGADREDVAALDDRLSRPGSNDQGTPGFDGEPVESGHPDDRDRTDRLGNPS
jgi:hypothetical protein